MSSLDLLENTENWKKFENYNTVFSCLGSRSKLGKEAFYKVDYTYVHYGAKIAKINSN